VLTKPAAVDCFEQSLLHVCVLPECVYNVNQGAAIHTQLPPQTEYAVVEGEAVLCEPLKASAE
jgi:hypothetical protein